MRSIQGLQHKTSVQQALENNTRENQSPSQIIGAKRSRSVPQALPQGGTHKSLKTTVQAQTVQFQRTVPRQSGSNRLHASRIIDLHDARGAPSEYTQRHQIAATPTATRDPELDLGHPTYDLPPQLVKNFASLGISQIYPWQKTCLKGPGLLNGTKNLVYCAPTGGGKSLVADGMEHCNPSRPLESLNLLS